MQFVPNKLRTYPSLKRNVRLGSHHPLTSKLKKLKSPDTYKPLVNQSLQLLPKCFTHHKCSLARLQQFNRLTLPSLDQQNTKKLQQLSLQRMMLLLMETQRRLLLLVSLDLLGTILWISRKKMLQGKVVPTDALVLLTQTMLVFMNAFHPHLSSRFIKIFAHHYHLLILLLLPVKPLWEGHLQLTTKINLLVIKHF